MKQTIGILFIIFLLSLTAEILSAHQEHFSKNEIFESSNVSVVAKKSPVSEDSKDKNCELINLMESECNCCDNGICFQYDKSSCIINNLEHQISCRLHCEDDGSDDNNFINQNFKSSNILKLTFSNTSITKNIITINLINSQKIITKSTPTYISIQSFLI